MKRIILNADVGEEVGFDEKIMPYISWCNIACGAHAGSEKEIQKTIELAIAHGVKIGAHPSYPDRKNFGRVVMDIPYHELVETITGQIQLVKLLTERAGEELHHVKPHGALYTHAFKNDMVAKAIIESVKNSDKSLLLISQNNSKIEYFSNGVLEIKREAFADRNYNTDMTLVSRSESEAVLTDPKKVFDHMNRMIFDGVVKTKTGEKLPIVFDTICVHGDTPNSVEILKYIYEKFSELNCVLKE